MPLCVCCVCAVFIVLLIQVNPPNARCAQRNILITFSLLLIGIWECSQMSCHLSDWHLCYSAASVFSKETRKSGNRQLFLCCWFKKAKCLCSFIWVKLQKFLEPPLNYRPKENKTMLKNTKKNTYYTNKHKLHKPSDGPAPSASLVMMGNWQRPGSKSCVCVCVCVVVFSLATY